jgi:phosphoribosylanthranilate isomerase
MRLTITGADDTTDIQQMLDITVKYPFLEWGILFWESRVGTARYPSIKWANRFVDLGLPSASHICGKMVNDYIAGKGRKFFQQYFNRVQLNFNYNPETHDIRQMSEMFMDSEKPIITQAKPCNEPLNNIGQVFNHHFLFDRSGGKGILPEQWPPVIDKRVCGYAGGLTPENLAMQVGLIQNAAEHRAVWVDMESGVCTNDQLDLDKVVKALESMKVIIDHTMFVRDNKNWKIIPEQKREGSN